MSEYDSDSAVKITGGQFCKTGRIPWSSAFALYSAMFAVPALLPVISKFAEPGGGGF